MANNSEKISDCARCGQDAICIQFDEDGWVYFVRGRKMTACKFYKPPAQRYLSSKRTCTGEINRSREAAISQWNEIQSAGGIR